MPLIAGVDLAWSGRQPTGLCVIDVSKSTASLVQLGCIQGDAMVVASLLGDLGPHVIAAIDAPLVVGPDRRAEADLARAYGRHGVYAYTAHMPFLERSGIAEGPRLGAILAAAGWSLDPATITLAEPTRVACEVFPHAAIVSLFRARRALRYKKGPLATRHHALRELQALLVRYSSRELPCLLAAPALSAPLEGCSGVATKRIEDQLDAIICAITACHIWRSGSESLELFGDTLQGSIAVPRPATSSPAPSSPSARGRVRAQPLPRERAAAVPAKAPHRP